MVSRAGCAGHVFRKDVVGVGVKGRRREAQQAREVANREFVAQAPGMIGGGVFALLPGKRPSKQARYIRRQLARRAGATAWAQGGGR